MQDVTEVRFEIVSDAHRVPAGRACRIDETDGVLVVQIRPPHATPALCQELNWHHRQILHEGAWAQTPVTAGRVEEPPAGLQIADVRWEIDSAGELPPQVPCLPLEGPGCFTWRIGKGHATQQLCDEMNEYLARIAGDGLWVQNWGSADAPPQPS